MQLIEHTDYLSLVDLNALAGWQGQIYDDVDLPDGGVDVQNAEDTLKTILNVLSTLGYHINFTTGEETAEEIAGAIQQIIERQDETLISDLAFTDAMQELVEQAYPEMHAPDFLVIDWEATANVMKNDYTTVTIGNEYYYIRKE